MTATTAELKDLVRRVNEELWEEGNLDFIDEYVDPDYVEYNTAAPEPIRGRAGYRENVEWFHSGFSDVTVTTEDLIAEGDKVVNHYTITATHDGEFMGIDPTGTEVSISGISIGRFEDGKVVEGWSNIDVFGLLTQLGVVEPPGQ